MEIDEDKLEIFLNRHKKTMNDIEFKYFKEMLELSLEYDEHKAVKTILYDDYLHILANIKTSRKERKYYGRKINNNVINYSM